MMEDNKKRLKSVTCIGLDLLLLQIFFYTGSHIEVEAGKFLSLYLTVPSSRSFRMNRVQELYLSSRNGTLIRDASAPKNVIRY